MLANSATGVGVTHTILCSLLILPFPAAAAPATEISSNSEASEADRSIIEKMEKIVSDDSNIAVELNLPKPEDVAGVEARDEEKKEDIVIEGAKEEISIPVEDKGSHDTTDVPDTPQPAEDSEASIAEDPVGLSETIKDVTVETDDKILEPPSVSIAQELAGATVDTNGVEPPVEAPKEPAISETVSEEVSGADSSNIVEHGNPVEPASESIAQEPSPPTFVEEKPADEEVSTNAVEVSPQIPKEELPFNGTSDVVPSEPKEVQVETLIAEKNVEDDSDHNVSETIEVAEHVAKPELDAKKENLEKNLDNKMTTSTETTQSIAEGVEVSEDAKDVNLEGQNSNLVELSRDIKMVEAESNVPSDDKQCESKELETELKPNKQTLLDTFENANTADKEQDTGSLTETKADEEVIKAELSGKKPKTIISKVKQSIVKVKKALIGKSPSSKTMAPEGIDETKAR